MRPRRRKAQVFITRLLFTRTAQRLAAAVGQVRASGVNIYGAADHGVSQAVYFDDPDGNGIELYWDRDPTLWNVDSDGVIEMVNSPLDIDALISDGRTA